MLPISDIRSYYVYLKHKRPRLPFESDITGGVQYSGDDKQSTTDKISNSSTSMRHKSDPTIRYSSSASSDSKTLKNIETHSNPSSGSSTRSSSRSKSCSSGSSSGNKKKNSCKNSKNNKISSVYRKRSNSNPQQQFSKNEKKLSFKLDRSSSNSTYNSNSTNNNTDSISSANLHRSKSSPASARSYTNDSSSSRTLADSNSYTQTTSLPTSFTTRTSTTSILKNVTGVKTLNLVLSKVKNSSASFLTCPHQQCQNLGICTHTHSLIKSSSQSQIESSSSTTTTSSSIQDINSNNSNTATSSSYPSSSYPINGVYAHSPLSSNPSSFNTKKNYISTSDSVSHKSPEYHNINYSSNLNDLDFNVLSLEDYQDNESIRSTSDPMNLLSNKDYQINHKNQNKIQNKNRNQNNKNHLRNSSYFELDNSSDNSLVNDAFKFRIVNDKYLIPGFSPNSNN
ncbi:hypothetical protein B5S28_g2302 [[Candida] boidinii]|uniref:Unnamed protein product n=1 Tax=Candida boidinii TaxID=5477 RepID=A0ACB5TMP7_CANBO|nr:hypothetical protein B5S28_g2302 [[Candida] boidinii]OWB62358.1 hypothetical protein B5S29_g3282 [[Candida] boidinii]OWB71066.1 hypothetical protein B5S31_g749 [[Candida] boidinii]GME91077.1 unnamed protein product [[Candida] boidinii]